MLNIFIVKKELVKKKKKKRKITKSVFSDGIHELNMKRHKLVLYMKKFRRRTYIFRRARRTHAHTVLCIRITMNSAFSYFTRYTIQYCRADTIRNSR